MPRRHRLTMPNRPTIVIIVVVAVCFGLYLKWTAQPAPPGPGVDIARQSGATGHPAATGAPAAATPAATATGEPDPATGTPVPAGSSTGTPTPLAQTSTPTPTTAAATPSSTPPDTSPAPGTAATVHRDAVGHLVVQPNNPGGDPLPQVTTSDQPTPLDGVEAGYTPSVVVVQWQRLRPATATSQAFDIAVSATDGPTAVDNGVPTGFARTPLGAALAAWAIYQSVGRGGEAATRAVLEYITDPQLVATATQMAATPGGTQWPTGESLGTSRGFTVTDYSPDRATIRYAIPAGGNWRAVELSVVYTDGRWTMGAPKQGKFTIITAEEEAAYTQW
ncbi:hypothetical protein ACFSSC_09480 [Corynebacterium mendelii]|uniref:DUF8175 domain-containing protein n=1 Tax=Corynebacterium mendelii TaxID=2765362 RepID=A0A939E2F7_9CORY|nr:hypothetical protein [Corynebacterium mendelii]MBN9645209.1 hypothetical protein [Corynebacterium mendelii]